tara:strand:+ start:1266 stop:1721 length:456 start_codon:yes stop_codon:yes gene_type:complete
MTTKTVNWKAINNQPTTESGNALRPYREMIDGQLHLIYNDGIFDVKINLSNCTPSCRNGKWSIQAKPTGVKRVGTIAEGQSVIPKHLMESTDGDHAPRTGSQIGLALSMFWKEGTLDEATALAMCKAQGIDPNTVTIDAPVTKPERTAGLA